MFQSDGELIMKTSETEDFKDSKRAKGATS